MEKQFNEGHPGSPAGRQGDATVQVIQESMGLTRYVLPKRPLGAMRKLGWIPLGIGVFVVTFMIFWMHGAMAGSLHSNGLGKWIGIGFGLMGLPGLAAGLGFLALGVAILTNAAHSEIAIGEGTLCAIERIGPILIRRRRFISQVTRLVVEKGGITVTDANRGTSTTFAKDLALLRAEVSTGKPFVMVVGYPHDVLRPLADTLAAAMSLRGPAGGVSEEAPVVEVVEREAGVPAAEIEVPKPSGTDITCLPEPHGLAISVPPKGIWKGSQGLFFFSLLWNGFMVVFTVLMTKGHPPLPVYLFVVGFWAIGLGMLAGAISMGKRRTLIAVVNDALAYRVIGPFKTTESKVSLAEIDTIRVGPSGVEVNNRPLMEVQIIPKNGKKIGLLSTRSRDEQEWLAYVLRQHLQDRRPPR